MTIYAIDAIDDALEATRAFLWPVEPARWVKIAIVLLFVGGAGGTNPFQFTGSSTTSGDGPPVGEFRDFLGGWPALDTELVGLLVVAGLVILGIIMLFMLVGAVMEFIFVESLRREAISIRDYWRTYWRRGVRLFGFRVIVGFLTLGILAVLIGLFVYPMLIGSTVISLGLLVLVVPVGLLLVIVSGLVAGFTTMFIVPIMLLEDRGVLDAWRRFWPTVTSQWKQYAAYAVLGFVLELAGGIVAGIATVIAAVIVALPLGLIGLLGWGLLNVSSILGGAVIAIAGGLFVLAVIALVLLIRVPIRTYLRYYGLLVLGETNDAFDVIPERRRAIQA